MLNFKKDKGKFTAEIRPNNKKMFLGYFETPDAAARAYDIKAVELFGEHACLNFPEAIL